MSAMISRNGDEVKVVLYDGKGNRKEIMNIGELGVFESGELNVGLILIDVVKKSLKKIDFYGIFLLSVAIIKRVLGHEDYRERLILSKRLGNAGDEYAEITFRNKRITLPINTPDIFINHKSEIVRAYIHNEFRMAEKNIKNKVIVDAGANIGLFSLMCSAFEPKRIYAFEPVKETYETLKANIKRNKLEGIIVPINKALGDKSFFTEINYRMEGDTSASIELKEKYKNTQRIEVVKLDEYLKGERVSFIKMNVEGYEENILIGARDLIKKYKPVLFVSAHHKSNDEIRLPEVVRSIRSDYKITLQEFKYKSFYFE